MAAPERLILPLLRKKKKKTEKKKTSEFVMWDQNSNFWASFNHGLHESCPVIYHDAG